MRNNHVFSLSFSLLARYLYLHCTPLKTSHRRTQRRGPGSAERVPFSFVAFLQASDEPKSFGIWTVDEFADLRNGKLRTGRGVRAGRGV